MHRIVVQVMYHGSADEVLPRLASLGHKCPKNYNPADFMVKKRRPIVDAFAAQTVSMLLPPCDSEDRDHGHVTYSKRTISVEPPLFHAKKIIMWCS